MTDANLLPLPEGYDKYSPPRLYDGQVFHAGQMRAYARANSARAIAPLQAEIEALRAEVKRLHEVVRPRRDDECLTLDHWRIRAYYLEENWSRCSRACAGEQDKREKAEARAAKLEEALRLALKWVEVVPPGEPLHKESETDLAAARAALTQEGRND